MWCNLYFVSYEIWFLMRLAKLGHYTLMAPFVASYRYMDDLCILNHLEIGQFLQPDMPRDPNNPYWVYPLPIV